MLKSSPLIENFISFNTVSQESNFGFIEFARKYVAALDGNCRSTFDEERRKANLLASIGPLGVPGIVLSGYAGVVTALHHLWTSNPFNLRHDGGKIIGRGVSDMKGFLAIDLSFTEDLAKQRLSMPIHLAISYGEEVGCLGVQRMIDDALASLPMPRLCTFGGPSGTDMIPGNKGKVVCHVEVFGSPAHSAMVDLGVNAVQAAARAVADLCPFERMVLSIPISRIQHTRQYKRAKFGAVRQSTSSLNIACLT